MNKLSTIRTKFLITPFNVLLPLLFIMLNPGIITAQCSAPTSVSHTTTSSTCASNGSITAGSATGGAGDYLEYALYNAANTTEVRPWQTGLIFSDLASGSYTLRVRFVCGIGYSETYTKPVTVGGSYTPPSITSITVQRRDQCNNGRISVSSTGGTSPKTYALVPSLSAPEPIALSSYIRVPQASTIFDSLAAGTYYVRVYDACGSYSTSQVVVSSFTQINPYTSLWHTYWFCDSLSARLNLNYLGDYVTGTADTLRSLWITYPDGSTDTLPRPNVGGSLQRYFNVPLTKLGTVGSGSFPDNIGGTWPKYFQVGFKDACGNTFITTDSLVKPTLSVTFAQNTSAGTCDSSAYRFSVTSTPSYIAAGLFAVNMNNNASFSLDGGSTWQPVASATTVSPNMYFEIGSAYNTCFAYCGDTTCFSGTISGLGTFSPTLIEHARFACTGNSGIQFFPGYSAVMPVAVEMLSGPDGQTFDPDTITIPGSISAYNWLSTSKNLIPGTYSFRFTDSCGRVADRTITISHPYEQFDFNFSFPCGSTTMEIPITNDAYWNIASYTTLATLNGGYKANIYNADGTLAIATTYATVFGGGSRITIPSAAISALPNGDYFIRVWKDGADSCTFVDKPWQKTSSLISLSNSLSVTACPGTPTTGTVIAIAQGGNGIYSYSLYEGSVDTANLVAGPQSENIFNGLDESATYIVTVSDTCGRGTQATMSFGSTPLPVYNNAGGTMPCPGDTVILSVQQMPGVSYQWYKNNTAITADTLPALTISDIDDSDSGDYKVELTIGTCTIFLSSFILNPAECGTPLNVDLIAFTAKAAGQNALLQWRTSSEQNNKGFEVERSYDGSNWINIGFVDSKGEGGNSQETLSYSFADYNPLADNYYRLKQIDMDGRIEYSHIEQLSFGNKQHATIAPNPTKGLVHISGLKDDESITVTNVVGQVLSVKKAESTHHVIDISHLSAGIYIINITDSNGIISTYKISKE